MTKSNQHALGSAQTALAAAASSLVMMGPSGYGFGRTLLACSIRAGMGTVVCG